MSFQKTKTLENGVEANYHTITEVNIKFTRLPTVDVEGSQTEIVISSFVSRAFYESVNGDVTKALSRESYAVDLPFVAAALTVPDGTKSAYEKAEDKIIEQNAWYADAVRVQ